MVEGVSMHLQCTVSGAQVGHILEQTRNILYFFLEFYFIFFPTSRIYLKTNKEHSIVFSLEYYWHRIRPIPMMTNPIHGPLSYRSLWMNSTFWSFFWVWFDSDQVSWILILAFAVCLLVARRSSHGRVTATGKKIARHTITLLTTSERKEHI